MYIVFACLVISQPANKPLNLPFHQLSASDATQVVDKDIDAICKILLREILKEADKQNIDPNVRSYLEISFFDWERQCRLYTEFWKKGLGDLDSHNSGGGDEFLNFEYDEYAGGRRDMGQESQASREIRRIAEKKLQSLINQRHFAKFDAGRFGQLVATGRVLQIIDDRNVLAFIQRVDSDEEQLVWFADVDTTTLVDGVDLPLTFFVRRLWTTSGNRRYTTPLGASKTVLELSPYPLEMQLVLDKLEFFKFGQHLRAMEKASKLIHRRAVQDAKKAEYTRTWRDSSGKFTVVAQFGGLIGGDVKLIKEGGEVVKVPIDRLSDADRDWIANLK